jgi:predicted Fe-Mo cluster-binding NifX family protein
VKIAVASDDRATIASHFGRCRWFLVYEARDGQVAEIEARPNDQAGNAAESGHQEGHHAHDHGRFAELLGDCAGLVTGGIGPGAVAALEGAGISVATCPVDWTPAEAVAAFLARQLGEDGPHPCSCGHGHD